MCVFVNRVAQADRRLGSGAARLRTIPPAARCRESPARRDGGLELLRVGYTRVGINTV